MKKGLRGFPLLFIVILGFSCGKTDDGASSGDLSSDSAVGIEAVQATLEDGISSMADQDPISSSSSFKDRGLLAFFAQNPCENKNDTAVVSITKQISQNFSVETTLRKISGALTGTGEQVRTWSRSSSRVECNTSGQSATIDWKDVAGLRLSINFTRSRDLTATVTNSKGVAKSRSISYDANGSRILSWPTTAVINGTSIALKSNVTSKVVRSFSVKRLNGSTSSLKLSIEAAESEPLAVTTTRSLDLGVQTRSIDSGRLSVTDLVGGGRVETTFTSLKMDYSSGNCTAASGSAKMEFYPSGSSTASKTWKVDFDQGVGTVTLDSGVEVGTIDINGCDPEDVGK